jgi:hypothetical protein
MIPHHCMTWQERKQAGWSRKVASTLKLNVQAKTKAKIVQSIFNMSSSRDWSVKVQCKNDNIIAEV